MKQEVEKRQDHDKKRRVREEVKAEKSKRELRVKRIKRGFDVLRESVSVGIEGGLSKRDDEATQVMSQATAEMIDQMTQDIIARGPIDEGQSASLEYSKSYPLNGLSCDGVSPSRLDVSLFHLTHKGQGGEVGDTYQMKITQRLEFVFY